MRKMTKMLAFALAVVMAFTMVACGPAVNTGSTPSASAPAGNNGGGNTANYVISIKTAGGMPMQDVDVMIYEDETLSNLVKPGRTGADGTVTLQLKPGKNYVATLSGVPAGYAKEDYYSFTGNACNITLTSSLITDKELTSGKRFQLGDIMYDFTITDNTTLVCECGELNSVDPRADVQICAKVGCGKVLAKDAYHTTTLSETLAEKKMVMLNFWYSGCTWCEKEFPAINSAYAKFSDKMEIFALDDYLGETVNDVLSWKTDLKLDFPMGLISVVGKNSFGGDGWPMTVIIDRYGMIAMAHAGAITSEYAWSQIFTHFTAEDYEQKLVREYGDIVSVMKPDKEFPGSDAIANTINKGDINVNYYPANAETDGDSAEYSWPFITTEYQGVNCIKSSNSKIDSSFSILYADVYLEEGQAVGFDYLVSTEYANDAVYIIVNDQDIYQISGDDTEKQWKACYPWVALEAGTYQLAICYIKDGSTNVGEDAIFVKDMRVIDAADIEVDSYIPRQAAVEQEDGSFKNVEIFYNDADGYYHVNSVDGPLLLANLMGFTQFCDTDFIYNMAVKDQIIKQGHNYKDDMTPFASYASNASPYGFCTVTQELADILKVVAEVAGYEGTEYEWLKICEYYEVYGPTGKQMADPIKGLCPFSAPEAVLGTWQENENGELVFHPQDENLPEGEYNLFYYDRPIIPRGKFFKFTPEVSGAYRIISHSDYAQGLDAWIFTEEGFYSREPLYTYAAEERGLADEKNVSMVYYMEAGKTYYIDIAFWDVYNFDYIPFDLIFLGETYDMFRLAAPGNFTFIEGTEHIISAGVEVALGEDGIYYHVTGKDADGNPVLGSPLYADFSMLTTIFSDAIMDTPAYNADGTPMLDQDGQQIMIKGIISKGGFDFRMNEYDQEIMTYLRNHNGDVEATKEYLRKMWKESYEAYAAAYKLDEIFEGIYHGPEGAVDRTEEIKAFLDDVITEEGPAQGCVIVTAELADLLQALMDKFTFAGVENSWQKLCYYFDYMGR